MYCDILSKLFTSSDIYNLINNFRIMIGIGAMEKDLQFTPTDG